jgi:hypothetical protein
VVPQRGVYINLGPGNGLKGCKLLGALNVDDLAIDKE